MRRSFLVLLLVTLISLFPTRAGAAVQGASTEWCFLKETGQCIRGRFLEYWLENGGLARQGMPLSPERNEVVDGKTYKVQYFERARFEYHPENKQPYDVLLGLAGIDVRGYVDPPVAPITHDHTIQWFGQTGHNAGGFFLEYWNANGGLSQFGYPITEEYDEVLEDGRRYRVQWFQRSRFEYHPENPESYKVLLGQLGRTLWDARNVTYPLVLSNNCAAGRLVLERNGVIRFNPHAQGFKAYQCSFILPSIDPAGMGWRRYLYTENALLSQVDPNGLTGPVPLGSKGLVQLYAGRQYWIDASSGSWFVLDIVP